MTRTLVQARARRLRRQERRAARHPQGQKPSIGPGRWQSRGRTSEAESAARQLRTEIRFVKRRLKAGRPRQGSNTPRPTFDWEKVVNDSQREAFKSKKRERART